MQTITFNIQGMTCPACAALITMTLEERDGVTDVTVQLGSKESLGSATVIFDPKITTEDAIKQAVIDLEKYTVS